MVRKHTDRIIMKTLGSFSIVYKDRAITGKNKSNGSQFIQLMQLILHKGKEGIKREELEEALFKGRDLDNIHHTTQTVIYNAKKRLKECGLPDINLIYQKDGNYYWNKEVPIEEDARVFEDLVHKARKIRDDVRSIPVYFKALQVYEGNFLNDQTSSSWIERENWRLRNIFSEAVRECADRLRRNSEYEKMIELGNHASKVQPFSDWEVLAMEGLICLKRFPEAGILYENTIKLYHDEQGIQPSDRLAELVRKLSDQMEFPHYMLHEIQERLREVGNEKGGYLCPYPTFKGIYQALSRINERSGQPVFLMSCTIVDSKGNIMENSPKLDDLSERLGNAIINNVRRSDIVNKYSRSQYLILLTNTTRKNCEIVQRRINKAFIINRQRIHVEYHVSSIREGDHDE